MANDYAIANDYNHIQLNGPIHNLQRSNLDGMMFYRKYSQFNDEKDAVNQISIVAASTTDVLKMKVTIGTQEYVIDQPCCGKSTVELCYPAGPEESTARIKLEKISDNMPLVYEIQVF